MSGDFSPGFLVVFGQSASVVGIQSVIGLLLVAEFPSTVPEAAGRAGLVLAGGLFQALLVVSSWPLRRYRAERRALAAVYRTLAGYAAGVTDGATILPDPATLTTAHSTLADPAPFSPRRDALVFRAFLDEAERIRTELAALAHTRERLDEVGATEAIDALDRVVIAVSAALAVIAEGLSAAQPPSELSAARDRARDGVRRLDELAADHGGVFAEAVDGAQALLGQIRAVIRLAVEPSNVDGTKATTAPKIVSWPTDILTTVRANLTLSSTAFRHAIRVGAALAIGTAIYRLVPLERGYWVPLTTMVVLRPEFGATFSRGLARIAGTIAGAVLATAIAVLLQPGPVLLAVLIVVIAWITYTVFRSNYAAFSLCVTALVVFLLAAVGLPEATTMVERIVDTLLGGVLALVAFLVWPTWERRYIGERLAELLDAQKDYGTTILNAYVAGNTPDRAQLRTALDAARRARSNTEASVDRWLAEPAKPGQLAPDAVLGILAAIQRYAHGMLTLHARMPGERRPMPTLSPVASGIGAAFSVLASSARQEPDGQLPRLRDAQLAFADDAEKTADDSVELVVAETDHIVDAVDTMGYLLGLTRQAQQS